LKIINGLLTAVIIGITVFFSFFWIGSYQQKMQLIAELPSSFITHAIGASVIGSIGIVILLLVNFLHDKIVHKKVNVASLKRLAIVSFLRIIAVAIFGTALFFYS
jgi:hypothetical protein